MNILEIDTVDFDEEENAVVIIDQTKLPGEFVIKKLKTPQEIYDAIYRLEVRGAPAIGVAAAIGLCVTAVNTAKDYPDDEEGTVSIQADTNGKEVRFTITDSGVPFDPTAMLEPDTKLDAQNRPIGGLGILLSRRLMDSIYYSRKNGKNVLSLTKTIL